jgi:hypothetical protein
VPGGEPATPLANGGAFGGKADSLAPRVARELAERHGRAVRVVYSREDCVRLGPKRPPIAASAVYRDDMLTIEGIVIGHVPPQVTVLGFPYALRGERTWTESSPARIAVEPMRAFGLAENAVLAEGALDEAGIDRSALVRSPRRASAARHRFVRERDTNAASRGRGLSSETRRDRTRRSARCCGRPARRGRAPLVLHRRLYTWRSVGCAAKASPSIPIPVRCSTSPSVRSA